MTGSAFYCIGKLCSLYRGAFLRKFDKNNGREKETEIAPESNFGGGRSVTRKTGILLVNRTVPNVELKPVREGIEEAS